MAKSVLLIVNGRFKERYWLIRVSPERILDVGLNYLKGYQATFLSMENN